MHANICSHSLFNLFLLTHHVPTNVLFFCFFGWIIARFLLFKKCNYKYKWNKVAKWWKFTEKHLVMDGMGQKAHFGWSFVNVHYASKVSQVTQQPNLSLCWSLELASKFPSSSCQWGKCFLWQTWFFFVVVIELKSRNTFMF